MTQPNTRFTHIHAHDVIPGLSQAVIVDSGRTAYLSGHVPVAADGTIPESFEAQLDLTFANLQGTLDEIGATVADVARMTMYVVGLTDDKLPQIRAARNRFIGETSTPPASTLLGVASLFSSDVLFECELVVSLPS